MRSSPSPRDLGVPVAPRSRSKRLAFRQQRGGRKSGRHRMRTLLALGVLGLIATGCYDSSRRVVGSDDLTAPGEPHDLWSITGDGEVTLYWTAPGDYDLAGFSLFISQDDH